MNIDKSVRIENVEGPVTGVIGADNVLIESLNTIQASNAPTELKEALKELTKAVSIMCEELPPDKKAQTARDLQVFTEEATAEEPRPSVMQTMGTAITKTAEAVSKVGAPVVKLVKAVLALT